MGLLEELKEQREAAKQRQAEHMRNAFEYQMHADIDAQRIRDLDRAIAALEPSYHPGALKEGEIASGLCSYEEAQAILSPAVDGGSPSIETDAIAERYAADFDIAMAENAGLMMGERIPETSPTEPAAYAPVNEPEPKSDWQTWERAEQGEVKNVLLSNPAPEPIAYFINAQGGSVEMRSDGSIVPLFHPEPEPLPPLFPPEPEQPATPEELERRGLVDSEASWWARKLAKEPA